jgi:hypothetical protein
MARVPGAEIAQLICSKTPRAEGQSRVARA